MFKASLGYLMAKQSEKMSIRAKQSMRIENIISSLEDVRYKAEHIS